MSGASPGQDRLSTLATMIGELEATSVYGRVTAVHGLLVEVSGPISAMSLGGRVGIEIAPGVVVPGGWIPAVAMQSLLQGSAGASTAESLLALSLCENTAGDGPRGPGGRSRLVCSWFPLLGCSQI